LARDLSVQKAKNKASNFFTIARFEPDSMLIYATLVTMAVILYATGFSYIAIMPVVTLGTILTVESLETIRLEHPPTRQLLGKRCRVLRQISKAEKGVVKIADPQGRDSWELWSAESTASLQEGSTALITGMRGGMILEVQPIDANVLRPRDS
jgi:membrane protein implicated in regulation of membrane protease activity